MFGKNDIFTDTGKTSAEHMIQPPYQANLPERSILLKKIPGKTAEGIVVDSGDMTLGDLEKSLNVYKVKNVDEYVNNINILLEQIRQWMKLTGNTMFIMIKDKRLYNPKEKKFVY